MSGARQRQRSWKRWALSALVWISIIELGAWIADARWHFRYALLDGLRTAAALAEPPRPTPLQWPEGTLRARVPDQFGPREGPYIIGGREIQDAWPDGKQEFISLADCPDDDRFRVFVVGGSAAFGYPYRYESSFAVQLEKARPDLHVVNVAQVGWASGQVLTVAERILERWSPRALVVYSGNNEWIQWTPRPDVGRAGIDVQRLLAHSRTIAGALWLGHRRQMGGQAQPVGSSPLIGFEHALDNPDRTLSVARWQREKTQFLDAFHENLTEIRRRAEQQDVKVIFLTVPFNYRLSPSWKHRQPDAFEATRASRVRRAIERAGEAVRGNRCDEALPILDEALSLDPEPAIVHYLRAFCLERQGSLSDAEAAYARSREAMVGNLGSRLSVNDVIRDVSSADGAQLLDVHRLFDELEHRRERYFNEELIHDDCHPTPLGHQLIAESLAELLPAPAPEAQQ